MMDDVGGLCRLCRCDNSTPTNIFLVDPRTGYVVANIIDDLLRVEITDNVGLPGIICSTCHEKLFGFKEFKELCLQSIAAFEEQLASRNAPRIFQNDTLKNESSAESLSVPVKNEIDEKDQLNDSVLEDKDEKSCISDPNPLRIDEVPGGSEKNTENPDTTKQKKGKDELTLNQPVENEVPNPMKKGNRSSKIKSPRSDKVRRKSSRNSPRKKMDLSIGKWKQKLAGILKVALSTNNDEHSLGNLPGPSKRNINELNQWENPILEESREDANSSINPLQIQPVVTAMPRPKIHVKKVYLMQPELRRASEMGLNSIVFHDHLVADVDRFNQWSNPISQEVKSEPDESNSIKNEVFVDDYDPWKSNSLKFGSQSDDAVSESTPSQLITTIKEEKMDTEDEMTDPIMPPIVQYMNDENTSSNNSSNLPTDDQFFCSDNPDDIEDSDEEEFDFGNALLNDAIQNSPEFQGESVPSTDPDSFFVPGDYIRSGLVEKLTPYREDFIQKNHHGGHIDYSAKCKILALEKSMTVGEVAYCVGVHPRTVRRWMAKYKSAGEEGLKRRPGSGNWKVTTPEEDQALIQYIRDNPNTTPSKVKKALNYSGSLNTIRRRAQEEGLRCGVPKTKIERFIDK